MVGLVVGLLLYQPSSARRSVEGYLNAYQLRDEVEALTVKHVRIIEE